MTNKSNEILQALKYVYRELSKWSLRNAANDNPSAALVFFSFLKYVSDNEQYQVKLLIKEGAIHHATSNSECI